MGWWLYKVPVFCSILQPSHVIPITPVACGRFCKPGSAWFGVILANDTSNLIEKLDDPTPWTTDNEVTKVTKVTKVSTTNFLFSEPWEKHTLLWINARRPKQMQLEIVGKTHRSSHLVNLGQETMPSRHSPSSMRATFRASAMPPVRSKEALKDRKTMESIGYRKTMFLWRCKMKQEHVFGVGHAEATKANNQRSGTKWMQWHNDKSIQVPFWPQFAEIQTWMHRTHIGNSQELADWQIGPSEAGIQWSLILSQVSKVEDVGVDSMEFPWHVVALKPTRNLTFLKRCHERSKENQCTV